MADIVPTTAGQDLQSPLKSHDAHIRLERDPDGRMVICVDVFDSSIENPTEAHVASKCEPNDPAGAAALTDYLISEWGFDVTVRFG